MTLNSYIRYKKFYKTGGNSVHLTIYNNMFDVEHIRHNTYNCAFIRGNYVVNILDTKMYSVSNSRISSILKYIRHNNVLYIKKRQCALILDNTEGKTLTLPSLVSAPVIPSNISSTSATHSVSLI